MDEFKFDFESNNASSADISIDDILAEFQADQSDMPVNSSDSDSAGPGIVFFDEELPDLDEYYSEPDAYDEEYSDIPEPDKADDPDDFKINTDYSFSDYISYAPAKDYINDYSDDLPDLDEAYPEAQPYSYRSNDSVYDDFDSYSYADESSVELEDSPAPEAVRRKSVIGSMRNEARRLIAQIQAQKSEDDYEDEEAAPVYGDLPKEFSGRGSFSDRYEYDADDDYDEYEFDGELSGLETVSESYSTDSGADEHSADLTAASGFSIDDISAEFADAVIDELSSIDEEAPEYSESEYSAEMPYDDPDISEYDAQTAADNEEADTPAFDAASDFDSSDIDSFLNGFENNDYSREPDYDSDPGYTYGRGRHEYKYTPSGDEPEIDSRFNLGGKARRKSFTFGSHSVDQSADENYVQPEQSEYNPSQWTPDYDDPLSENEEDITPQRKKHKFRFGKKKSAATEVSAALLETDPFDAREPSPGPAGDSTDQFEVGSSADGRKFSDEDSYFPPTFKEYVLSIFASVFLKIRGSNTGDTNQTMRDTEEDLGPELSPADAARYYGSFIKSMRLRTRISAVLLVILCYISLGLPVPGMLRYIPVLSVFCFALQSAVMLLALDVVTTGILNAFRLRFGADSLAVLSCILTGADALIVALSDSAAVHIPFCALSSLSIVGLLLASSLSTRGLRKAMRVPAIGKRYYTVTGELMPNTREVTLLKSMKSVRGFIHRTEEAGPDESLYVKIAPFAAGLALLFALITAIAKKSFSDFLFIFSAILAPSVPFAAMLAFALPFFLGSSKIFRSGASIAGWSGLCDIGVSKNLIITDRDLFPESSITMESVRIFADEDAQKVISYAGSMMSASGSSSAACFLDLMDENGCVTKQINGFEYMPGGGLKGIIEGHIVLCGSTDLMRLMNVRIPFRLMDSTTVLLAIDGILYGIFSLHYEPLPQVRKALVDLMRSNRHPVFAMADFNITPDMLHTVFDIPTDGYDFPPYVERFELLKPADESEGGRIAAVICNEGLGPLTHTADMGRSMYVAIRINVFINALSSAAGIFTVFIRLLANSSISLGFILLFMIFWAIPVVAVSLLAGARK